MRTLMMGLTPPLEGGSERHIYEFSKKDKNVEVLTQKGSMCERKIEIPIFSNNRLLKSLTLILFSSFFILIELIKIKRRYDIIHFHENVLYFLVPIANIRFKTVVTVHGLKGFKFYDISLFWKIQKFFLSFATLLIAVGLEDQKILHSNFKHVTYIPNGVDLSPYNKVKAKVKDKLTFVGRIHEQKGIIFLLKAFKSISKEFPHTQLIIIGAINAYAKELMNQFPDSRIVWRGYISSRPEMVAELKSSSAIVLPSLWEGLPLTLFESLASERPVIVSDLPTIKSVVNDSEALLFKTGDTHDLASKIKYVLTNPGQVNKVGINGKKIAEKYDWSKLSLQLKSAYKSLLK